MIKGISFLFVIYADGQLTIINCQGIIFHRYKTGFWTHGDTMTVQKEWKQALKR